MSTIWLKSSWCLWTCPSCGIHKPTATDGESICCFDKHEICESYFKAILSFEEEIKTQLC